MTRRRVIVAIVVVLVVGLLLLAYSQGLLGNTPQALRGSGQAVRGFRM